MAAAPTAFISHADEDSDVAFDLCRHLERSGVECWIAPRDVSPGQDYAAEIVGGIERCDVFVLLLSAAANASPFVRREVERAASKHKPMYPVRLDPVQPGTALEFFVSSSQWIDAFDAPRGGQWSRLARAIRGERERPLTSAEAPPRGGAARRKPTAATLALAAVVAALAAGAWLWREPPDQPDSNTASSGPPAAPSPPSSTSSTSSPTSPPGSPSAPVRAGAGTPVAGSDDEACPQRLSSAPELATPYRCRCDAAALRDGVVWGSDVYTADSIVCRAALHAGAVDAKGGVVTVERVPGRDLYAGSLRRGVRSSDYGRHDSSIRFAGTPSAPEPGLCPVRLSINPDLAMPYSCVCSAEAAADGTVWGSDVYTMDSSVCRAALHAGAIGPGGGTVTIERRPGRDLYAGTLRRGVRSSDYGRHGDSMRFAGTAEPPDPGPCPVRPSINPDLATPYTCLCSAEATGDGAVWGTDLYTADSAICRAALHAGKIAAAGGKVTLETGPGRDVYAGTNRNGVSTYDHGRHTLSFRFR